jgi:hypothetical protein
MGNPVYSGLQSLEEMSEELSTEATPVAETTEPVMEAGDKCDCEDCGCSTDEPSKTE